MAKKFKRNISKEIHNLFNEDTGDFTQHIHTDIDREYNSKEEFRQMKRQLNRLVRRGVITRDNPEMYSRYVKN